MSRRRDRVRLKGGEWDALTRWRHMLCVFDNNTGLAKWWKRYHRKRIRRMVKAELREQA